MSAVPATFHLHGFKKRKYSDYRLIWCHLTINMYVAVTAQDLMESSEDPDDIWWCGKNKSRRHDGGDVSVGL